MGQRFEHAQEHHPRVHHACGNELLLYHAAVLLFMVCYFKNFITFGIFTTSRFPDHHATGLAHQHCDSMSSSALTRWNANVRDDVLVGGASHDTMRSCLWQMICICTYIMYIVC